MTYDSDPTRWTQAPHGAPDVLRDAFAAARKEGPNDLQMRALALKLAAMSGGAALASSASAAHASTTGAAVASSGSALSVGKVALSVALVGALAAGAAYYRTSTPTAPATPHRGTPVAEVDPEPVVEPEGGGRPQPTAPKAVFGGRAPATKPSVSPSALPSQQPAEPQRALAAGEALANGSVAREPAMRAQATDEQKREARRERVTNKRAAEPRAAVEPRAAAAQPAAEPRAGAARTTASDEPTVKTRDRATIVGVQRSSEIELLRRARESLDARPHEAFRLTEQHRRDHPNGVFGQERDALAIEALLRAGDFAKARARAEDFVDDYPSSPHAHRFRETMKLTD